MKLKYPIFWGLLGMILGSLLLSLLKIPLNVARSAFLILAIGNTIHSIEEYFTQVWTEAPNSILPVFHNSRRTQSQLDAPTFVMVSLAFNITNWFMFGLIPLVDPLWSLNYGAILLFVTLINGIIHIVPVIKDRKYNSGVVSIWVTIVVLILNGIFVFFV